MRRSTRKPGPAAKAVVRSMAGSIASSLGHAAPNRLKTDRGQRFPSRPLPPGADRHRPCDLARAGSRGQLDRRRAGAGRGIAARADAGPLAPARPGAAGARFRRQLLAAPAPPQPDAPQPPRAGRALRADVLRRGRGGALRGAGREQLRRDPRTTSPPRSTCGWRPTRSRARAAPTKSRSRPRWRCCCAKS